MTTNVVNDETAPCGRGAQDCGEHRQAAKSSDKNALSCTVTFRKSADAPE
jgi:hypothetical protein